MAARGTASRHPAPVADRRIVVGLSGGVDSSVAAALLAARGEAVEAWFMLNWGERAPGDPCPAERDAADALAVCERLGLPLNTVNLAHEYRRRVFAPFLAELRAGRTPNPDVLCNREVKFDAFLRHARARGASHVATGHYARAVHEDGRWWLLRGVDADKDQSYFLHALTQQQLAASLFPIGHLEKSEVRAIARRLGLATAGKRDSTGICFIGERDFAAFIARYLPPRPGPIVDTRGRRLGTHRGLWFHTLGQRRGLGLGGIAGAQEGAWYVVDKDPRRNALVVSQDPEDPLLMSTTVEAGPVHWITAVPGSWPWHGSARTRHRQPDQPCAVEPLADGHVRVTFAVPQRAVTPGQYVVFYDRERCLGGAPVQRRIA